jgi:hypothetical protein
MQLWRHPLPPFSCSRVSSPLTLLTDSLLSCRSGECVQAGFSLPAADQAAAAGGPPLSHTPHRPLPVHTQVCGEAAGRCATEGGAWALQGEGGWQGWRVSLCVWLGGQPASQQIVMFSRHDQCLWFCEMTTAHYALAAPAPALGVNRSVTAAAAVCCCLLLLLPLPPHPLPGDRGDQHSYAADWSDEARLDADRTTTCW